MSTPSHGLQVPVLEEYQFHSKVPVLGPLISGVRRALYNVAARWGVLHVIAQQNQINAQLIERVQELEARLIDQDRDLTLMARTIAEWQVRQRYQTHASADEASER